jgi:hypothetical protein
MMRGWVKNQPSLLKFCKEMRRFLFADQDGEFSLWPIRNPGDIDQEKFVTIETSLVVSERQ